MSVSSTVTQSQYVGNNSTVTAYPTGFRFDDNDWVQVIVTDEDGADTVLEETTDYVLTGAEDPSGGDVVTVEAVPATSTVTIRRETPRTQLVDLEYNDRLPAEQIERAFDKLTFILQEIGGGNASGFNGIQFPASEPSGNNRTLSTPVLRRGKLVYFNATTGELEEIDAETLAGLLADYITGIDTAVFAVSAGDNNFTGANAFTQALTLAAATLSGTLTANGKALFAKQVEHEPLTLTDAASIAWDASLGNMATVTLGGNRTLANLTNLTSGKASTFMLKVTQDGTGSRTLAYGNAFKFPGGAAPVLSTSAGAVDVLTFATFSGTNLYLVAQKAFA